MVECVPPPLLSGVILEAATVYEAHAGRGLLSLAIATTQY